MASAFALAPEVILLDEPTSGVSSAEKHGLMKTLIGAAGVWRASAIILVEHDMDLVASYSQRIIALRRRQECWPTCRPAHSSPIRGHHRDRGGQAGGAAVMLDGQGAHGRHRGQPHPAAACRRVGAGELVCLVGRNGAGKSTTFRTIMGCSGQAHSGSISL